MAERAGTNELGAPASDAAESSTPQTPLSETRNPFADAGAISSSGSSSRSGSLNERHGAPRAVLHEDLRSAPCLMSLTYLTLPHITINDLNTSLIYQSLIESYENSITIYIYIHSSQRFMYIDLRTSPSLPYRGLLKLPFHMCCYPRTHALSLSPLLYICNILRSQKA